MCDKRLCSCRRKAAATKVDPEILAKLEKAFTTLSESDGPSSLLKKHLTREVFDKIKLKKTSHGSTLLDVIRSGIENLDSGIGVYAPDPDSYNVFGPLFNPIIDEHHGGFAADDVHPLQDWGDPESLPSLDPSGLYVVSTRIRCGRSLEGYPFNPRMTESQYDEVEKKVVEVLEELEGDVKGSYHPLVGMEREFQQKLIDEHFLFKEGDRFLQAANGYRYWPTGRGIFFNEAKTFLVWCNEEDHLRIISMQDGGDLGSVYLRFVTAMKEMEKKLTFSHDERIGFLNFCPTNLGCGIRASVHIKLPKLSADSKKFKEITEMYNLQIRGRKGERWESEDGVIDISNKRRVGLTEIEAIREMKDGVIEMIKLEEASQ